MLILKEGDRTAYVNSCGAVLKGTVTRVVEWTGGYRKGFTYYVQHDEDAFGQFDWTTKYLFKEGDPIPDAILNEHLLD